MKTPIKTLQEWYDAEYEEYLEEGEKFDKFKRKGSNALIGTTMLSGLVGGTNNPLPTIHNKDTNKVYFKSEDTKYGPDGVVEPGGKHYKRIDGVATAKHRDSVYKVPDYGRVEVLPGGKVEPLNRITTGISGNAKRIWDKTFKGEDYKRGWTGVDDFPKKDTTGWGNLFKQAKDSIAVRKK